MEWNGNLDNRQRHEMRFEIRFIIIYKQEGCCCYSSSSRLSFTVSIRRCRCELSLLVDCCCHDTSFFYKLLFFFPVTLENEMKWVWVNNVSDSLTHSLTELTHWTDWTDEETKQEEDEECPFKNWHTRN